MQHRRPHQSPPPTGHAPVCSPSPLLYSWSLRCLAPLLLVRVRSRCWADWHAHAQQQQCHQTTHTVSSILLAAQPAASILTVLITLDTLQLPAFGISQRAHPLRFPYTHQHPPTPTRHHDHHSLFSLPSPLSPPHPTHHPHTSTFFPSLLYCTALYCSDCGG
jgi:hypothetical protein